jgi:hypothetical protein
VRGLSLGSLTLLSGCDLSTHSGVDAALWAMLRFNDRVQRPSRSASMRITRSGKSGRRLRVDLAFYNRKRPHSSLNGRTPG